MANPKIWAVHGKPIVIGLLLSAFLVTPVALQAQETEKSASQQAKETLKAREKAAGGIGDRCALGIGLSANRYVFRKYAGNTQFELGDRLISVGGKKLTGSADHFEILAKTAPDASLTVEVERAGAAIEFTASCFSVKPYNDADIRVLTAMSKRDWRGCLTAVRDREALAGASSENQWTYMTCGRFAKAYDRNSEARIAYEAWRRTIDEAQWDPILWPSTRGEVIGVLSAFESNNQARLAADLQSQIDAIDRSRNRQMAGAITAGAQPPKESVAGTGTGFFVNPSGMVLTSYHVVDGAKKIEVSCGKNKSTDVSLVVGSESTDLALLSTGIQPSEYLTLARPRTATVGQGVFTYGFPVAGLLGSEPKFTDGVISSLSGIGGEQAYMQISIPVQPGNSGGPVVNDRGEVVGIVAAGAAIAPFLRNTGTLPQNVNWAVKAEYASLLFDAPPQLQAASARQEAIQRVERSLCFIQVH